MGNNNSSEMAADLAANAALLEMADVLGLSTILDQGVSFSVDEVAAAADIPEASALSYLRALLSAGLVAEDESLGGNGQYFTPCADLADRRYDAGYLSWSLNANRPYIDHAAELLRHPEATVGKYQRDGRRVAISSRWIGSYGFYPEVISEITRREPARIVDLGAGAAGLLIHLLKALPGTSALALDLSAGACEAAELAAREANVQERLTVVNRSIESLIDDPGPVRGADVVHAGFVMHDATRDMDVLDAILRACREAISDNGALVITDAIPYADNPRERAFSALFTYLHEGGMGILLPSEETWRAAFLRAGFSTVTTTPLRMPGSRVFVAVR
jgi:2-polyprenyl-3-methyl-5-hydroxy-6-metoxy-1,4-benzoquinol methylase